MEERGTRCTHSTDCQNIPIVLIPGPTNGDPHYLCEACESHPAYAGLPRYPYGAPLPRAA